MLTSEALRDSFKYLYRDELPALKELVRSLPDNPFVVNIGAGAGTSGLAILESRSDVALLTIDVQDASSPHGCLEAERDVIERAGLSFTRGVSWFQTHASSIDVARYWRQAGGFHIRTARKDGYNLAVDQVDMVFIDGNHSYEGCKADIEGWLPLIKIGGIIAVHDYRKELLAPDPDGPHPKAWDGVSQAVEELLIPSLPTVVFVSSLIAFRKESAW